MIHYRNQPRGSAEEISEENIVISFVTHIPTEFATMVTIPKLHSQSPTSKHMVDTIQLEEENAALVTEIAEALTGVAHGSQPGSDRSRRNG
jgi:sorbitol-specific phosphotransferase system component IIA